MVSFREKLLLVTIVFTFLNILIFIALFTFSDEFRASGTMFAGMIIGNLVVIISGLAGFSAIFDAKNRDGDGGGGQ